MRATCRTKGIHDEEMPSLLSQTTWQNKANLAVAKAKKATNEKKSKQSKANLNDNKGAQFEAPNTATKADYVGLISSAR